jgi:hypothetical protein
MIISEIKFFLSCATELRAIHANSNPNRQKQLETFLKTWLFYNSSSKNIFWTGKASKAAKPSSWVKEHQFGNLSSARYILRDQGFQGENDIRNQVLTIFKFMQWNYTTKSENNKLKQFQSYDTFYDHNGINGDPNKAYLKADIITDCRFLEGFNPDDEINFINKQDLFPNLNHFLSFNTGYIFEFDLSHKNLNSFIEQLMVASQKFAIEVLALKIGSKGCLVRLMNNPNDFTKAFKVITYALVSSFSNIEDKEDFLKMYPPGNSGVFRTLNNFKISSRVFEIDFNHNNETTLFIDTYKGNEYMYKIIANLLEIYNSTCIVYDENLNQKYPIITKEN